MQMFIGNATRQIFDFAYRLPEVSGMRSQSIPIGSQVMVSGDLQQTDIDHILYQHERYGLIPSDRIKDSKAFNGICYSVGKPISVGNLIMAMEHNQEVLREFGANMRREAAVAASGILENNLEESGRPETLTRFETSAVEENHDSSNPEPPLAEGFRVLREPGREAPRSNRRQQRRGN